MPAPVIRTASSEDVDRLLALESDSFDSDRIPRRSFRHFVTAPTAELRLATLDGVPVGYYLLLFRARSTIARLYSIAVDAGARGQGLATRLLDDAEAAARRRGAARLGLEVRADNPVAIRLYERRGYVLTGLVADYYEDGAQARRYEKRLDRPDRSRQMDD